METQLFLKNTNILSDPRFRDKRYLGFDEEYILSLQKDGLVADSLGSWLYDENYGDSVAGVKFGKIHGHLVYSSIGGGSGDNTVQLVNFATHLEYNKKYKVEIKITGVTYSGDTQYVQVGVGNATTAQFHGNGIFTEEIICPYVADVVFDYVSIYGRTDDTISSTASTGFFIVQYCNVTEVKEAELDLYDNINLPLNFSIGDIRNLDKRNSSYSKDFTIPGTKKNNRIFNHIFEIDSDSSFNPKKRIPCYVLQDGIEVLSGAFQLNSININGKDIEYNIALIGKFANIFNDIGTLKLTDLDLSQYGHTYSKDYQKNSWETSIIKDETIYDNFDRGSYIYSTQSSYNYNGYLGITFSSSHGFNVGDTVYVSCGANLRYEGWFKIIKTPTTDSAVLNINYSDLTISNAYTINPKGEGYVYPLINYGTVVSPSGYDNLQWFVEDIYPAIYVKTYIDSIFNKIEYTYDSTFFDSNYFKSLIIPTDSTLFKITKQEKEKRLFRAEKTSTQTTNYTLTMTSDSSNTQFGIIDMVVESSDEGDISFDNDSTSTNFDNNNLFDTSSGIFTVSKSGYYILSTRCKFNHSLYSATDGYVPSGVPELGLERLPKSIDARIYLRIFDVTASSNIAVSNDAYVDSIFVDGLNYQEGTIITTEIPSTYLQQGRQYKIKYYCSTTLIYEKEDISTISIFPPVMVSRIEILPESIFFNKITNDKIGEGDKLDMSVVIPVDVSIKDFLISIIKMFNLYITVDSNNERNLLIETRDTFYSDSDIVDWTDKLDVSRGLEITLLPELVSNIYTFGYKEDKDWYNNDYQNNTKRIFGDEIARVNTDIVSGTTDTKLIFSPTPLDDYASGTSMILPNITTNGYSGTTGFNIRILFYGGIRYSNRKWYYTQKKPILSSTLEDFYPYCGHLDNPDYPTQDLNFGLPDIIYQPKTLWTENNLFNRFHRKTITEITDKDSKLVTGYFKLSPIDIYKLDFKNQFFVNGHYLRLNKIIDYNPNILDTTKVEFYKCLDKPVFDYGNIVERFTSSGSGVISDSTDRTDIGALD